MKNKINWKDWDVKFRKMYIKGKYESHSGRCKQWKRNTKGIELNQKW